MNGITSRLDYLKQLGVHAIWITPFFLSRNADFGYDISDYVNVVPEYGTFRDRGKLVSEANKRGIRILIDFVLNYTSDQHPWFKESRSSRDNPKRDWYVWKSGRVQLSHPRIGLPSLVATSGLGMLQRSMVSPHFSASATPT